MSLDHPTAHLHALRDNSLLAALEAALRRPPSFTLCAALGLGRQELRHSALLAYLLDPRQPHGLGTSLAAALLHWVAPLLPKALNVSTRTLDGLKVRRAWEHIDILLLSPHRRLAVVIENKIDRDEHANQLHR